MVMMSQWPSPLLVWQLDLPGNLLPPWASNLCLGDLRFTKEIHILASRQTMLEQASMDRVRHFAGP